MFSYCFESNPFNPSSISVPFGPPVSLSNVPLTAFNHGLTRCRGPLLQQIGNNGSGSADRQTEKESERMREGEREKKDGTEIERGKQGVT